MAEINLLEKYPKTKRNLDERVSQRTEEDIRLAKQFGKEYFDGTRNRGYGGYNYNEKYWTEVVKDFIKHYRLTKNSKILDIGCGKGFMLHDFKKALPDLTIRGIDISEYAIENSMQDVKPFLSIGNAKDLSAFSDKSFDLVLSINTVHNLKFDDCCQALKEIQRVGKNAFIMVDAYRNEEERKKLLKWNLTAETYMHVDLWKKIFEFVGYKGDYYWFFPE